MKKSNYYRIKEFDGDFEVEIQVETSVFGFFKCKKWVSVNKFGLPLNFWHNRFGEKRGTEKLKPYSSLADARIAIMGFKHRVSETAKYHYVS